MLFRASAETLLEVVRDPRHLGAEISFFTALHNWSQESIPFFFREHIWLLGQASSEVSQIATVGDVLSWVLVLVLSVQYQTVINHPSRYCFYDLSTMTCGLRCPRQAGREAKRNNDHAYSASQNTSN
jgi:hypothetical protein